VEKGSEGSREEIIHKYAYTVQKTRSCTNTYSLIRDRGRTTEKMRRFSLEARLNF
jgi:hypothetical protein